ncbi:hypothetical protein L873DRAFT_681305 [Choiromyces venosus 120613-1]|uniref:Uncharacterized protein n=1 Tax=Choiromyces venosus 120613-1 TaxID=1336337 RepID=A0A3N4J607_9PEZI|nr:hypothetical protein L873DRAFT_752991 [Choiromyces venosus 120613-1]RPA89304.1 hypothetical protein L873DRAFT_681305 [Choiromyces venosus 120613-1]
MKNEGRIRRKLLSPQAIVLAAPDSSHRHALNSRPDMHLFGDYSPSKGGKAPDSSPGVLLVSYQDSFSAATRNLPGGRDTGFLTRHISRWSLLGSKDPEVYTEVL